MRKSAFTLIELLIVVAIIAILAAIAVPNFLEAQVRSKVSRIHTELRTIATGLEAYRTDNNGYPVDFLEADDDQYGHFGYVDDIGWLAGLSTPVAYLTSANLVDPFDKSSGRQPHYKVVGRFMRAGGGSSIGYGYINLQVYRDERQRIGGDQTGDQAIEDWPTPPSYALISRGPDRKESTAEGTVRGWGDKDPHVQENYIGYYYDPTNGTTSEGDVVRWGPG